MNKIISYALMALSLVAAGCKKQSIMLYEGDSYMQFAKSYTDSSVFSFLALPDDGQAQTPLVVNLVGSPGNADRTYNITIVKEQSTATEADYSLPSQFTLKANTITDTAWLTVKKTAAISTKPVKLVLKVSPTQDFKQGQYEYSLAIFYISNKISEPDWWSWEFFGDYSDKKFSLFIDVTGKVELEAGNNDQMRYYTSIFKNYLLTEKDNGRTVYEEDGTEMQLGYMAGN